MFRNSKLWYQKIDWVNFSFLFSAHVIAIAGTAWLVYTNQVQTPTLWLSLFMLVTAGLAITAGYHRLFSHRAYEGSFIVRLFWLLFGAAAFQNSARRWSSDHRRHHKFVDTDRDPYNIKEGFLFAHIGWVLMKYDNKVVSYDDVPDLDRDPLVRFQDKYYVPLAIAMGFGFPTAIAALWGDAIGGFLLAGWLRIVINEHFTFSINSFVHMYGEQPYSDQDTSRDNWFFALFTYGEGYHNFHHKFPFDYRNAIKFHQWDPSKWIIRALSWMGLAWGLKRAPQPVILAARLKMDEKRMLLKLAKAAHPSRASVSQEVLQSARVKYEKAYARFLELKTEYQKLKEQKMTALQHQIDLVQEKMDQIRKDMASARQGALEAMSAWAQLCNGVGVSPTILTI